ncbi:hypothetical protein E2C01_049826 [Portunus trituberculatus]|uniref:Uncharacterized protein n=1 Tax=Portunus trituberculatus TaxID=210409 RepID=A0A5B7G7E6_PORTR|nr:hypothetical protein [Portunus trituberculatus]
MSPSTEEVENTRRGRCEERRLGTLRTSRTVTGTVVTVKKAPSTVQAGFPLAASASLYKL